jgi:membrane peptidoglycan carboxypeptidase
MHNVASYRDGTRVVHEPVYGGTVPSDIWHVYMNEALEGVPATDWEAPRDPVDWQPFESRHTRRAQERDRSDDGFRRGGGGYRRQGPSSPSPSPSPSAPGPDAPAPGSPPAGPPTGTVVEPEIVIAPG